MLHIILLILKIIGIILLIILGVLLSAIFCALFVPVRYRIKLGREEGEDKPPFVASVKITWLLHFVNILIRYPSDVIVRVRLTVIPILRLPGKEKKSAKTPPDEKPRKDVKKEPVDSRAAKQPVEAEIKSTSVSQSGASYEAFESDFTNRETSTSPVSDKEMPEAEPKEEAPAADVQKEDKEASATGKEPAFTDKIRKWLQKIKEIVEKIKALFENIQYTIRKFCDKIKSVLDNIQYYRGVIESEPFRRSFRLCRSELGAICKSLKPDKLEADLLVGMADPATTGQILAAYGMLYPLLGQHVRVVGNFGVEQTYAAGELFIRGKIRALTFLKAAIKIYFNKDIRKLIKLLKKEAV